MCQNLLTQSDYETEIEQIVEEVSDQVYSRTPYTIIEAIAIQIYTAREARRRINEEGSVVRDIRGAVVPHPAIKIEADAIKLYAGMIASNQTPKPK